MGIHPQRPQQIHISGPNRSKLKVLLYKVICIPLACIDCLSPFKFLGIKVDTNKDCIGVRDFIICLIYDIEQIGQPLNVRNLVR